MKFPRENLIFFLVVASFLLTYFGVSLLRKLLQNKLLDVPNERSSHHTPTPRGAGIAIAAVTLLLFSLIDFFDNSFQIPWQFLTGAILISLISLLDDYRSLPSWLRFGVHFIGAILAVNAFGYFQTVELPYLGVIPLNWLGLPLTLIWIVGLTNIYNFMDGIDGIAGIQAFVSGIGLILSGLILGKDLFLWLGILVAFTSLAFLWHNWSPARIFLGDVGSAFWGFLLAVAPLWLEKETGGNFFLFGVLLVWVFVFDGVLTIFRRALKCENIFAAHRSHLYQRLVINGISHSFVAFLYGTLALFGVFAGLSILSTSNDASSLTPISISLIIFCAISLLVGTTLSERRNLSDTQNEK